MHYLLEDRKRDRDGQMKMDTMEWRSYNKDKEVKRLTDNKDREK